MKNEQGGKKKTEEAEAERKEREKGKIGDVEGGAWRKYLTLQ